MVERLKALARVHPDGAALPVQVVSRENLWPLPFYLRGFARVGWWNGVSDEAPVAPVILATPDMEPAVGRRLYDVPPPGERELYVSLFDRPMELRPRVELRGYVANGLWERFWQAEAAAPADPSGAGADGRPRDDGARPSPGLSRTADRTRPEANGPAQADPRSARVGTRVGTR
jgi:hypothetical protein